ncbi:MAG TPA: hypothetical protein PLO53_13660, partial [Candidatus Hydrogenedentes bacterium]|nr:hypothetical protein [Candidatus Hydrogenedentota bacterium]
VDPFRADAQSVSGGLSGLAPDAWLTDAGASWGTIHPAATSALYVARSTTSPLLTSQVDPSTLTRYWRIFRPRRSTIFPLRIISNSMRMNGALSPGLEESPGKAPAGRPDRPATAE